jgi:phage major head subunit gpT-like protein
MLTKSRYDVALLYLKQVDYDLEAAIQAYKDDERWEKEHPIEANVKGKGKKQDVSSIGKRRFLGLGS